MTVPAIKCRVDARQRCHPLRTSSVNPITRVGSALLIAVALLGTRLEAQAPATVLGVLEQPPQCQEHVRIAVRPLFARRADGWVALIAPDSLAPLDLRRATFTLAFDGRNLGEVHTTDPGFSSPYAWTFTRDHLLEVVPGQSVPQIANRSQRFEGWCDPPAVRPIVAVRAGHYADPERWKPFHAPPAERESLIARFRSAAGPAEICMTDTGHPRPYRYTARDLVIDAAYANAGGRRLIALKLDKHGHLCDGPPEKEDWVHWFEVGGSNRYLGPSMELIDAGDYDGDGKSELLFWYSGYNEDGYVLVYDDLARRSEFLWHYH